MQRGDIECRVLLEIIRDRPPRPHALVLAHHFSAGFLDGEVIFRDAEVLLEHEGEAADVGRHLAGHVAADQDVGNLRVENAVEANVVLTQHCAVFAAVVHQFGHVGIFEDLAEAGGDAVLVDGDIKEVELIGGGELHEAERAVGAEIDAFKIDGDERIAGMTLDVVLEIADHGRDAGFFIDELDARHAMRSGVEEALALKLLIPLLRGGAAIIDIEARGAVNVEDQMTGKRDAILGAHNYISAKHVH